STLRTISTSTLSTFGTVGTLSTSVRSINAYRRSGSEPTIRPDATDAVPREFVVRRLALAFVALQKAGHEELLGERRELHPTRLAVVHDPVLIVEVDDFDDGTGLRGVIGDLVAVRRT